MELTDIEKSILNNSVELIKLKPTDEIITECLMNMYRLAYSKGNLNGVNESLKTLRDE